MSPLPGVRTLAALLTLLASLGTRATRLEPWDAVDPNRKMALEESPWLEESRGGSGDESRLVKVLEPQVTLYILHGLARAAEHGVELDRSMTDQAWVYLASQYRSNYAEKLRGKEGCCWEFLTLLEYVASSFPDASPRVAVLTPEERARIRDFSFEHWREHSPYLKGYLALKRAGRVRDARRVFDSVMVGGGESVTPGRLR